MDQAIARVECMMAVRNALGTSDFILENYHVETLGDTPIGFMARHLRLKAYVNVGGKRETLRFFTKTPPSSEAHRSLVMDMEYFQKETIMYEKLAPVMSKVLPEGFSLPIPRCYYTRGYGKEDTRGRELIVMEDAAERGFRLRDKMLPCDLSTCRQVMRSLARFHAPSFLLKKKWSSPVEGGKSVEEFFSPAKEMLLVEREGSLGYMWTQKSIGTLTYASARFWPERFGSQAAQDEIARKLKRCWKEIFEMIKPSRKYSNVLCHGDTWTNNMMFRYGKDGGRDQDPLEALLVDLQIIRYAPPFCDLLLFLHTSTTREFRKANMNSLLVEYHGFLEEIVTKVVLESMMPLASFLQSVEEHKLFGIILCTAYLPIVLNDEKTVPMMENSATGEPPDFVKEIMKDHGEDVMRNAEASKMYRLRLTQAYQECLEHLGLWK